MKKGKPLRRSPLKRGESTLKRTPLSYRSKKTEEKYVERRRLVKELLSTQPHCDACVIYTVYERITWSFPVGNPTSVIRQNRTVDVHELVNRSQGGSIIYRHNLIAVCRPCHSRITTEPKEAELLGLHLESWCNTIEHLEEAERVRDAWKNGIATRPSWLSA